MRSSESGEAGHFGIRFLRQTVFLVNLRQQEMDRRIIGREFGGLLDFGLRRVQPVEQKIGLAQLAVSIRIFRSEPERLGQRGDGFFRLSAFHQEGSQIEPGLGFVGRSRRGRAIGSERVRGSAQCLVREAEKITSLRVRWIQYQTLLKRADRFIKMFFVVPGAPQLIPDS